MSHLLGVSFTLGLALAVTAQGTLEVSLGVRETDFGGGTFSTIGGNGGSSGGIEWINLDGQVVTLDGQWRQYTFNITTDPVTGFAGSSANGILEGTFGTIEHIRIKNHTGITDPITLFIDDIENTTSTTPSVNFGDFETYPSGTEVIFQEPGFSGSTSGSVMPGATAGVANGIASRSSSNRVDIQFVDNSTTRWVRLTTFNASNQPNPLIRFDNQSVVTFWMRGGDCQEDLGSQGPGTAYAEVCGAGLGAGETSVFYTAGSPANAVGVIGVSLFGAPDLPIAGGNVVGGQSLIFTIPIFADAAGRANFTLNGSGGVANLNLQAAFLDSSLPMNITFTNALRARFGQ